ncbi:hypothetical protein HPP92_006086 [Vanilla planifolia]|uniref:Transcription repressor n=1 Tax=Vanilla planifolia TaxID=51239 RepID=A0A835RLF9_VANPL|nr:hypothetical protein HPP92_006086 [Vanilla planifolia]
MKLDRFRLFRSCRCNADDVVTPTSFPVANAHHPRHQLRTATVVSSSCCKSFRQPTGRGNPAGVAADCLSLPRETPACAWSAASYESMEAYPGRKVDSDVDDVLFPSPAAMLALRRREDDEWASGEKPYVDCDGETPMADESRLRSWMVAVAKQSVDPRGDFRRSMAEMVEKKEIYDIADLEQLLHCFLSLNSRRHHIAIVAAFADVWEALTLDASTGRHKPAVLSSLDIKN